MDQLTEPFSAKPAADRNQPICSYFMQAFTKRQGALCLEMACSSPLTSPVISTLLSGHTPTYFS